MADGSNGDIVELKKNIEALKSENSEKNDLVKKLIKKIEESNTVAQTKSDRAFELEAELIRLKHDSIDWSSVADQVMRETGQLRKDLEKMKLRADHVQNKAKWAWLKQAEAKTAVKLKELEKKLGIQVAERSVNNIDVEEKGLKLHQPLVVAGSTIAIVAVAGYFYYAKRR